MVNNFLELAGKKVLVVGLASTGISTARFLKDKGAIVTVTDNKPMEQLECPDGLINELQKICARIETGRHSKEVFMNVDLIVLSPGVPPTIKPLQDAKNAGIEIISEIELACDFIDAPIIAITGTNGKTTTTTLLGKVLNSAGRKAFVGGNIGTPLIDYASKREKSEYVVAEISSFQLEGIKKFKPFISILLNITEDHMDRYKDFNEYAEAKFNIFKNQGENDIAIVNIDDPTIKKWLKNNGTGIKARIIPFSAKKILSRGIYWTGREIVYSMNGSSAVYPVDGFKLKGMHNIENIMAVIAAAKICGVSDKDILATVNAFNVLPHRIEFIRDVNGVSYYDDSKGTNIGALQKSLEGIIQPVILIAGGKDKGGDYRVLRDLIKQKVKLLRLIGEAREKIKTALGGCAETIYAASMEDAVKKAYENARQGDIVLLSPACSSFDMFKDYKERGDVFRKLVEAL
ncbi:MAG: UDP-N-acetylmuramoyl-L-alanine--D-glutamate ligase [Deltaproteobacteria bacterium]|nr:UDP-N-acetylmuramoyl-L-alanine--D-glutamate ligase [Deltaproteobacteria bacterium]